MLDDEHLQGKVSMRAGSNRDGTAPEHDEDFFLEFGEIGYHNPALHCSMWSRRRSWK